MLYHLIEFIKINFEENFEGSFFDRCKAGLIDSDKNWRRKACRVLWIHGSVGKF
jgi:hypothetical protein